MSTQAEKWTLIVTPKHKLIDFQLNELWRYRDLIMLFVKRDFVAIYKQTILGPLWYVIQPILTTLVFTIIFGSVAEISTGGVPHVPFYLSGLTIWNYFSSCLTKTSNTFIANEGIFGKVYFPRLVVPLSIIISNLISFTIQFALFLAVLFYYTNIDNQINIQFSHLMLFPVVLTITAGLGLGMGIIISSLTTKYRDFAFLITFGVQLLMYATPIIYPYDVAIEKLPHHLHFLIHYNPMTPLVEIFRFIFLGTGSFSLQGMLYSFSFMILLLFVGIILFNKIEKKFMDTV